MSSYYWKYSLYKVITLYNEKQRLIYKFQRFIFIFFYFHWQSNTEKKYKYKEKKEHTTSYKYAHNRIQRRKTKRQRINGECPKSQLKSFLALQYKAESESPCSVKQRWRLFPFIDSSKLQTGQFAWSKNLYTMEMFSQAVVAIK